MAGILQTLSWSIKTLKFRAEFTDKNIEIRKYFPLLNRR
jgi:hypothetical protein